MRTPSICGCLAAVLVALCPWSTAQVVVSANQPYFENFESGPGAWATTGTVWQFGTPGQLCLDAAFSGSNAWMTRLTQNYPNNANVTVQATFDFSMLTQDPTFAFQIAYVLEDEFDGVVVEMDTGAGFQRVGSLGDGVNWYDSNDIDAFGQSDGWTSAQENYRRASITLAGSAGASNVVIRVRLASDSSVTDEGFVFDDVEIFEPAAPPFPGTDEGLVAFGLINGGIFGAVAGANDVVAVQAGDSVEMAFVSIFGNHAGLPFGILVTYFDFDNAVVPEVMFPAPLVAMFPELGSSRLYAVTSGPAMTTIAIGTDAAVAPLGVQPLLPAEGLTFAFTVPPVVAGVDVLFQAVVLDNASNNGFFATSNGIVIDG